MTAVSIINQHAGVLPWSGGAEIDQQLGPERDQRTRA
jgi:hypothetical protein